MYVNSSAVRTLAIVAAAPALVGTGAYLMQEASAQHRTHDADAFTSRVGGQFLVGATLLGSGALIGASSLIGHRPAAGWIGLGVLEAIGAYGIGASLGERAGAR